MSTLSLNRRGKSKADVENTPLGRLAKTHFRLVSPPEFSRKEPRQPLLKDTPDEEKETVTKIWRVMLRFTGDLIDYRRNGNNNNQPYLGSVITRLAKLWGISTYDFQELDIQTDKQSTTDVDMFLTSFPNKPKGGTMRRLRDSLAQHLFKSKNESIYNSLPIEDTLTTTLEQVHYIASCGILKPQLRDEIYCLICKHIVNNPYKTSVNRCWILLALIIGCFPPSDQIQNTIMEFVKDGPPFYANMLSKLLKNSLKNGCRHQPPSYRELDCQQQKKPIELQITLMDGTVQTIAADSTSMARDICERLNDALGLRKTFGYALYIAFENKVASLSSISDHIMDAISQCEQLHRAQGGNETDATWRLFYRKELFSPWEDTSGDIMAISLTFAQIARGIMIGEYVCDSDQELALLAARQYYIEYGSEICEDGLQTVLPSYIPADRRLDPDGMKLWRRLVIKAHRRLFGSQQRTEYAIDEVKLDVINYAKRNWAMAFSRYFDVTKLEGPQWDSVQVRLAVNSSGVYVIAPDKQILLEMKFPEIITIRGESNIKEVPGIDIDDTVLFVLANGSFIKFESVDAVDIRTLIHDIISGLRMRSVWAIARADVTGEFTAQEGDLIQLRRSAGQELLSSDQCAATNTRNGMTGNVSTHVLYVLPVLEKPSDDVLKLFRIQRRRDSLVNYLEDGSLQNLANISQRYDSVLRRADKQATALPDAWPSSSGSRLSDYTNGNVSDATGSGHRKEAESQPATSHDPQSSATSRHSYVFINAVDCVSEL